MRYIITILLSLVFATSVQADCAWILWEHMEFYNPNNEFAALSSEWKYHFAAETKILCDAVLRSTWEVTLKLAQPGPGGSGIKEIRSAPNMVSTEWLFAKFEASV